MTRREVIQLAELPIPRLEYRREMVSGESHYVWGARLRLRVVERPGRAHVEVDHNRLLLYMPEGSDREERAKVLQRWQREELRREVPALISK